MRLIISMPCMGKTYAFKQLRRITRFKPVDFDPKGFKPETLDEAMLCMLLFEQMADNGYTDVFCFSGNIPGDDGLITDLASSNCEFIFVVPTKDMYGEIIQRSISRDSKNGNISAFTIEYMHNYLKWRDALADKANNYLRLLGSGKVKVIQVGDADFYISDLYNLEDSND